MEVFYTFFLFFLVNVSSQEQYDRASDSSEIVSSLNSSYEGEPLLRSYPESEDYYFQNNFDQSAPQLSQEVEVSLRSEPYSPCQDGSFLPYPGDCNMYLQCSCAKCETYKCMPGLHWNTNKNICDWPEEAQCFAENSDEKNNYFPPYGGIVKPVYDGTGYKVICYFINSALYRPGDGKFLPSDIDETLCTHIIYGFATLDADTLTIKESDTWPDIDNGFYKKVTDFREKGIKVLITLGGWEDSRTNKYSNLVNNPSARDKFVTNVIQFICKYNFDGLNVEWRQPKCWQAQCIGPDSDKPSYTAFVRELSAAFKPKGLLLTTAVTPVSYIADAAFEVAPLSNYFELVIVLAYSYYGSWNDNANHIAPFDYVKDSVNYWLDKGVPPRKLILGIPFLGNNLRLTDASKNTLNSPIQGSGNLGEFTRSKGLLAYYEICDRIKNRGWTKVSSNREHHGPYAYSGNEWLSYDDVNQIVRKAKLIKEKNLGGAMVWTLDYDDFNNLCGYGRYPLLTAVNQELRGIENDTNLKNCL